MAEQSEKITHYSRDITGAPVKTDDAQMAEQLAALGQKPIGEAEAKAGAEAQRNLDYVDQNWGALGKTAAGVGS